MRIPWKWVAACVALLFFAAAMAPWTFSGSAIRQEVARQIRKATGLITETSGRTTLALLPRPRIKISDVVIRDADGKLRISAGVLRGDLRILPILAGRLELVSAVLVDPDFEIDADARPLSNAGAIARASEAVPASPEASAADAAQLGMVSIQNGKAHIYSAKRNLDMRVDAIDLTLDWPSLRSPAGIRAAMRWQDDPVNLTAWVGQPNNLLRDAASPVSIKLESPIVTIAANGIFSGPGDIRYQGKLAVSSPSFRRLMSSFGYGPPLPGPQEAFSFAGNVRPTPNGFTLSDLHASLDSNNFDGALTLASDRGLSIVSGTLATDLLVLPNPWPDPNLPFMAPSVVRDNNIGGEQIPRYQGPAGNVDLRISATKFRFGRLQGRDIALNLKISDTRKELTIDEASIYGGIVKGRIATETASTGLALLSNFAFQHLDLGAMIAEDFGSQRISGVATGEVALGGEGETPARLAGNLNGTAHVALVNGELSGLDLEQALRRLEKRPLSIASEVRSGRTPIATGDLLLAIEQGNIIIRQADAEAPGVQFSISGRASIPQRSLNLSIRAQAPVGGPPDRGRPQLALDVTGNWSDPTFVLDTQSLIRQSEAAAPLLRSLVPAMRPSEAPVVQPR